MCGGKGGLGQQVEHNLIMKRKNLAIFTIVGIYCGIFRTSAWSINNNLMVSGPKAYLTYSTSVVIGTHSGIEECKHQFAWERWNCPESAFQLFNLRLKSATRETSFVHAISSAGVVHTLTRNCSLGEFENCGCDSSRNGRPGGTGWIWGGCSDNVEFGEKISKVFVDSLETAQDARALMNLHNNEAGRQAVKATMRRSCKCHGVSGSCSLQTCWLQLSEFREVGNYLKIKYDQAQKLELDRRRLRAGNSADSRGISAETFITVLPTDLVFLEDSPDYCIKNSSMGLHGTEGRECLQGGNGKNLSHWERKSCRRLCKDCGLRTEEKKAEIVTNCNCKFQWCCKVKCEQCIQVVTKHYCSRQETSSSNNTRRKKKGHRR